MKKAASRWVVVAGAALALLAAACGGSDSKGGLLSSANTSSDKAAATSVPVTVTNASTAGQAFGGDKDRGHAAGGSGAKPGGPANGNNSSGNTNSNSTGDKAAPLGDTFKSPKSNYSVQYPRDWTAQANAASFGGTQIDGFLSPDEVDGFTPNVNILCDASGAGSSVDQYVKANKDQFEKQKITSKDAGKATTGSGDGQMLTYTTSFAGRQLDFAQILLTDKRCGWVLTLTTPQGMRDRYLKTFLAMAATFKATN